MNALTLNLKKRKGVSLTSTITKAARGYIDFVVSGQPLSQLLNTQRYDLIGALGWTSNKEYENNKIDELLGTVQPELENGRTCLYVCPECGDIGCGAITLKIEMIKDKVFWKEFRYEDDDSIFEVKAFSNVGPFVFDRHDYVSTIEQLRV